MLTGQGINCFLLKYVKNISFIIFDVFFIIFNK